MTDIQTVNVRKCLEYLCKKINNGKNQISLNTTLFWTSLSALIMFTFHLLSNLECLFNVFQV